MHSLAPIVLFVYNRPAHTRQVLANLQTINKANQTDLIIFSDGAKSGDEQKVEETRKLLDDLQGFKSVTINTNAQNLGLAKSIISGLNQVFKVYDKAIILEDDMLIGKHFLNYINEGLNRYKEARNVYTISGYAYNLKPKKKGSYFLPTSSNQAWATWKSRWEEVDFNELNISNLKGWNKFRFNEYGAINYAQRLRQTVSENKSGSWAIKFKWHLFGQKGLTLFPSHNLVENIGWDGSGTNCIDTNPYEEDIQHINFEEKKFPEKARYKRRHYVSLVIFHYLKRIKASIKYRTKK